MAVPQSKLIKINAVCVCHCGTEIITSYCLTVVALEIQLHAFLEALFSEQGVIHAHYFRTFFIDGHGVEVVHLFIAGRADRMRSRACIFRELEQAQHTDIVDTAHHAAGSVAGKLLITEYGQTFFQRQLEPIAAGHAVARPVVEIFVADNRFNAFKVGIGRGTAVGQHELGIENIQTFVFHRAHIEIAHGNDHENIQVVFQTEACFVPFHRIFQRFHCKPDFRFVCLRGVELDFDLTAAHGRKIIFRYCQIASYQSKEIARFGKRVFPFHPMTAV